MKQPTQIYDGRRCTNFAETEKLQKDSIHLRYQYTLNYRSLVPLYGLTLDANHITVYLPGVIKTGSANIFCIFSQLPLSNSLFTVLFADVVGFCLFCRRGFV